EPRWTWYIPVKSAVYRASKVFFEQLKEARAKYRGGTLRPAFVLPFARAGASQALEFRGTINAKSVANVPHKFSFFISTPAGSANVSPLFD
ncbi:MAG: hypothetical protein WBL55_23960, partial [Xanthobacteraceae bacterium]